MNSYIVDCLEPQPGLSPAHCAQTPTLTSMPRRVGAEPRYTFTRLAWVILDERCVTGFGQGGVRGQAWAGTGGRQGFPVNRLRSTSRGRRPCFQIGRASCRERVEISVESG